MVTVTHKGSELRIPVYSGDLNSELVRYLNGPKQFAS